MVSDLRLSLKYSKVVTTYLKMIHCISQVYALQTLAANLMFTAQPTKQISKIFYFAKALLFNFVILQVLFFSEL